MVSRCLPWRDDLASLGVAGMLGVEIATDGVGGRGRGSAALTAFTSGSECRHSGERIV